MTAALGESKHDARGEVESDPESWMEREAEAEVPRVSKRWRESE